MSANNPTPADLAALAGRLEEDAAIYYGSKHPQMAADLRMAARCVRAWAKLDNMIEESDTFLQFRSLGASKQVWVPCQSCGTGPTALAAVEEVKP